MDQLKRRFAALDLVKGREVRGDYEKTRSLLTRLRSLGPEGMEGPWAQLVDGLLGLASQRLL